MLLLTPPRQTRYIILEVTALKGTLTNATPESRATVELLIKNQGPELVLLGSAAQLQLADGRTYGEADAAQGWPTVYRDGATRQATLHFVRLPADASWRGAKLLITRRDEEPAVLPLDGPPLPAPPPVRLVAGAEAAVGPRVYRLLEATVGLDYTDSPTVARRAGLGQRILRVRVRATNNSRLEDVVLLGLEARLVVDGGAPVTPLNGAWTGPLKAGATQEGHVAFEVPATASRAEVRLSSGQDVARFPLTLR